MNKLCLKTFLMALLFFCIGIESVGAQDLLARQAPIDKKLHSIDSLALQKQINTKSEEYPALSLYPDWTNNSVILGSNFMIPESYTIDLSDFVMPTNSRKVTSDFGERWGRVHKGLDIKVNIGDSIGAAFDGKVRVVKYEAGYGRYIVIRHYNGLETVYGHLSKQLVEEGQNVSAGDIIGLGGNTGRSYGSHLHFETRFLGIALDPSDMFDFPNQDIVTDTYVFRKNKSNSPKVAKSTGVYYRVRKGDTLTGIAASKRVSVASICRLNKIKENSPLKIGQDLRLY